MKRRFAQAVIRFYYAWRARDFKNTLRHPETIQRERLRSILRALEPTEQALDSNLSYEDLRSRVNVRTYDDYSVAIEDQRASKRLRVAPDVVRFEPTSGSTSGRKWIPYSDAFLSEMNSAAAVWLNDVYDRYPGVRIGSHYWSLSWLPEDLRGVSSNDEADLFPWHQRWLLKQVMAVPSSVALVKSGEAAWWATLVSLASRRDLSLISVWSPTLLLQILSDFREHWPEIRESLSRGRWGRHEDELLNQVGPAPQVDLFSLDPSDSQFFQKLWPGLALISCWETSTSRPWADEIRGVFPRVAVQGKGLWATEGVVTIPYGSSRVLATMAHFYEFRDLQSGEIFPSWSLEVGRFYQPLIWTSSGLLRYALPDRIVVTGFEDRTPLLEFEGRLFSADLVGEKVDTAWVTDAFTRSPEWRAICLIAVRKPKPHYVLVHRSESEPRIEAALQRLHHYQVARERGQLTEAKTHFESDVANFLRRVGRSDVIGQNKVEALIVRDEF